MPVIKRRDKLAFTTGLTFIYSIVQNERDVKDFILSRFHKYIMYEWTLDRDTRHLVRLAEALIPIIKRVVAFSKMRTLYSCQSLILKSPRYECTVCPDHLYGRMTH